MRLLSRLDALIRELKRRGVLRAGAVYAVSAWVAVQVATNIFPALQLPHWTVTLIVVAAILGFPVVVAVAWAFEITPEGIRRTEEAEEETPRELVRARGTPWISLLLVGIVTVASVGIGWAAWGLWLTPTEASTPASETEAAAPPAMPAARVAVLPFDDATPDGSMAHVAEGLTRELIDALNRVSELDVVSYRGVMPYRGTIPPLDSVARAHNTGSVVSGTVEGTGESITVRLELADGRSGSSLWSDRFTASRDSVLALTERISTEAARQLLRELGEEVRLEESHADASSDAAWDLFHQARHLAEEATELRLSRQRELAGRLYRRADSLYRESEELDPDWLQPTVARAWLALEAAHLPGEELPAADPEWLRTGLRHANRALSAAPASPAALEVRGALLHAFSLTPAAGDSAGAVRREAMDDLEAAVAADVDRARAWAELSRVYQQEGRYVDARGAAANAEEADAFLTNELDYLVQAAHMALELGELEEALRLARKGAERFPEAITWGAVELLTLATSGAPRVPPDSVWAVLDRFEEGRGGEDPMARIQVAAALARLGLADSARAVLRRAKDGVSGDLRVLTMYYEANVRLQLGERRAAIELLGDVLQAAPGFRGYVANDLWWEPLRQDSAYRALLATSE